VRVVARAQVSENRLQLQWPYRRFQAPSVEQDLVHRRIRRLEPREVRVEVAVHRQTRGRIEIRKGLETGEGLKRLGRRLLDQVQHHEVENRHDPPHAASQRELRHSLLQAEAHEPIRRPTPVLGVDGERGDVPRAVGLETEIRTLEHIVDAVTPNGFDIAEALQAGG